jgi:hypothetical protein
MDINTTDGVGVISNADCSVCHYDVSQMYSPGFTVSTYKCEDCHVNGAVTGAPIVHSRLCDKKSSYQTPKLEKKQESYALSFSAPS